MWISRTLRAVALVAAGAAAGCTTSDQEAPGAERAVRVRTVDFGDGHAGPAQPGRRVAGPGRGNGPRRQGQAGPRCHRAVERGLARPACWWSRPRSSPRPTRQGRAAIFVTAPAPPAFLPSSAGDADDHREARGRRCDQHAATAGRSWCSWCRPAGTLPPNRLPVAAFTISPAIGNINQELRFDASLTMDEGEPCGDLCTYQWDFGDFETDSGRTVTKSYGRPGTYTITLTVTDSRGGVGSVTQSLTINGPAAPDARLTITPASAVGGTTIAFNAGGSTVGLGATIDRVPLGLRGRHCTDDDRAGCEPCIPGCAHRGPGGKAMNYPVVLTVIDNFGRTAVATGTATALPTPSAVESSRRFTSPAGRMWPGGVVRFRRILELPTHVTPADRGPGRPADAAARAPGRGEAGRARRHPAGEPALPGEPSWQCRRAGRHANPRRSAGGRPLSGSGPGASGFAAGLSRPPAPPGAGQLRRRAGRVPGHAGCAGGRLRGPARQRRHPRRLAAPPRRVRRPAAPHRAAGRGPASGQGRVRARRPVAIRGRADAGGRGGLRRGAAGSRGARGRRGHRVGAARGGVRAAVVRHHRRVGAQRGAAAPPGRRSPHRDRRPGGAGLRRRSGRILLRPHQDGVGWPAK